MGGFKKLIQNFVCPGVLSQHTWTGLQVPHRLLACSSLSWCHLESSSLVCVIINIHCIAKGFTNQVRENVAHLS